MNRKLTKRDLVIFLIICVAVSLFFIVPNVLNDSSQDESPVYTPPTPPNFTASQANGIVAAAVSASTPAIRASSGWLHAEFNYSTRQWVVTVWPSEEDSKKYAGHTYLVDDATGKLVNPPPVYNPK